jgi:alkanesulfonate monooxygenase SsuD/methylene tetrahydromethanopterin reductase-like flavin-dependent oxidoreductase (luciferase family)
LRDAGASGVATFEGPHDVFAPLTLAATVGGLDLMTNVAIAFPRNPIHLAHQANDHQLLGGGRFILGLGTQVRAQIEKRFGAHFDNPVARTTELIAALRAIFEVWSSGDSGARLNFRGEYYRHTLMTQTFNPGPNPYGPPPIYVGALGPKLTRATAEHADGLLVMPFGSKRFLHHNTMPAVREGLRACGRHRRRPGRLRPTGRCWPRTAGRICSQSSMRCPSRAGLGAPPACGGEMGALIDDEMMHTIAACGTPAEIAAHIRDRVDGISDTVCLYQAAPIGLSTLAAIIDELDRKG